jgi:hypothetical protein
MRQQAQKISEIFDRGLLRPSPDFEIETLGDKRQRLTLRQLIAARLTCHGGEGGTLFVTSPGFVEVQILAKNPSAIFIDEIWLFAPQEIFIGTNLQTGLVKTIGPFDIGAELIFGIIAPDTVSSPPGDYTYKMGDGSRNPDGLFHDIVYCSVGGDDKIAEVDFEDLLNQGDHSFNDARFLVSLL